MIKTCSQLAYTLWSKGCEIPGFYKNLATCTYRYDRTVELASKYIKEGDSVLDVGTGSGTIPFLLAISFANIKIKGIDITDLYLPNRLLNSFLAGLKNKVVFEKRSIFDLEEKADVVICTEVIEHLGDDKLAMGKLISAAKKTLILTTPTTLLKKQNITGHLRHYTKEMLVELAKPFKAEFFNLDDKYHKHFHFMVILKGGEK